MRTSLECLGCVVNLAVRAARLTSSDPRVQQRILREALIEAAHIEFAAPPVLAGRRVQRLVRRLTGRHDPYRDLKRQSTALALRLVPEIRRRVHGSRMPLEAALAVATAANTLDFGIYAEVEERAVQRVLLKVAGEPIGEGAAALAAAATTARDILYIGDNAGEIVFDGLVMELLGPAKVTLAVRGGPILNDATLEDAKAAGLAEMVLVVDTGSDVPGVILDECSDEFRRHFESADLIISKGQGNYETLDEADAPIWFALKIKCPVIARAVGGVEGQSLIWRRMPGAPAGNQRPSGCLRTV
jgi:damage-control phosphatase, subfamily I